MRISELAARTGLSVHTIRYYERIGLLPAAPRDKGGQRLYPAESLGWIAFVERMRVTGMPIRQMLAYARLRAEGPHTGRQRQAMLESQRGKVRARIAELQACLTVLDAKIEAYSRQDCEFAGAPHDPAPAKARPGPLHPLRNRPAQSVGH